MTNPTEEAEPWEARLGLRLVDALVREGLGNDVIARVYRLALRRELPDVVDGMTRQCYRCEKEKPLEQFRKDRRKAFGRGGICLDCDRRKKVAYYHDRGWQLEQGRQRVYTPPIPERDLARRKLREAVRNKKIVKPERCQECDKKVPGRRLHGHHHDYDKPFEVEWLCTTCHGRRHRSWTDEPQPTEKAS